MEGKWHVCAGSISVLCHILDFLGQRHRDRQHEHDNRRCRASNNGDYVDYCDEKTETSVQLAHSVTLRVWQSSDSLHSDPKHASAWDKFIAGAVAGSRTCTPHFNAWANVAAPTPVSQPHYLAIQQRESFGMPIVGGLLVGLLNELPMALGNKKQILRGKDCIPRKKRTCAKCVAFHETNKTTCNGRIGKIGGSTACHFFNDKGESLLHPK